MLRAPLAAGHCAKGLLQRGRPPSRPPAAAAPPGAPRGPRRAMATGAGAGAGAAGAPPRHTNRLAREQRCAGGGRAAAAAAGGGGGGPARPLRARRAPRGVTPQSPPPPKTLPLSPATLPHPHPPRSPPPPPSPYLLQHAHNPVDWYPWGEEAFAAARAQDKPIFLSVGYSTCHWVRRGGTREVAEGPVGPAGGRQQRGFGACARRLTPPRTPAPLHRSTPPPFPTPPHPTHPAQCHVMERESFEDEEAAALLNEGFVAVKVDREERPDVDRVYVSGRPGGRGEAAAAAVCMKQRSLSPAPNAAPVLLQPLPRAAAPPRPPPDDVRAGADGARRVADERVADAAAGADLWGDLPPAQGGGWGQVAWGGDAGAGCGPRARPLVSGRQEVSRAPSADPAVAQTPLANS
jgi:hypothetical protein